MSNSGGNLESKSPQLYLQAGGILAAAVLLGLIYNEASPLGVRLPSEAETQVAMSPQPVANAPDLAPSLSTNPKASAPSTEPAITNQAQDASQVPPLPVAAPTAPLEIPTLTWPQVKALIDAKQIVLIDARLKQNYDISHIPTAISFPAMATSEELQEFATRYPKDTRFVVYCGSASCHMSRSLAQSLVKVCGYTNVSEMPGGFAEYLAASPGKPATP